MTSSFNVDTWRDEPVNNLVKDVLVTPKNIALNSTANHKAQIASNVRFGI